MNIYKKGLLVHILIFLIWWGAGASGFIGIRYFDNKRITGNDIAVSAMLGFMGPTIWVALGLSRIAVDVDLSECVLNCEKVE